ncbi:MAG: aminoacyltransferase [Cohaesibacter sp.]|nr:aminoacyltransferase [Cohaesibacter sp.]
MKLVQSMDDVSNPIIQDTGTSLQACFVNEQDWDSMLAPFVDVLHEQTQIFNAHRWQGDCLERIAFYQNGKLVAAAAVMLKHLPMLKSGLAVTKWGPLWRRADKKPDPQILKLALEHLVDLYAHQRGYIFSVFPFADPDFADISEETYQACGFEAGESLTSPNRYFVNCQHSEADARASLLQKWRYNLKKAEKNNLTVRELKGEEGFEAFMPLYEAMLERKNFHDASAIDTLEALSVTKETYLQPDYVMVEKDGEPVACAVIDMSGDRAVYLYGATSDRALPLKAGYVMHWAVMKLLLKNPRIDWYDLGGADESSPLHQFKRSFVGKEGKIAITPPYYHYTATLKTKILCKLLYFIRRYQGVIRYNLHGLKVRLMERLGLGAHGQ